MAGESRDQSGAPSKGTKKVFSSETARLLASPPGTSAGALFRPHESFDVVCKAKVTFTAAIWISSISKGRNEAPAIFPPRKLLKQIDPGALDGGKSGWSM